MRGALLCLLSAAAFGTLGIFGRLASDAGASIAATLFVRFAVAALVFWVVLRFTGGWRRMLSLPRHAVLIGLGLGAIGYALQSGLYFAAIQRLDVSLVALLLYTYPAFVTIAALVLLAAGTGTFDLGGALLALAASVTYTTYILISDRIIGAIDPFALAALVLTGAAASFTVTGLATGSLDLALGLDAWLWLLLIAFVSTVVAVSAFFAGLRRVGPSEAAILSTFEPVVTVALAYAVLGERLAPAQLAGGALVLAAVVLLQIRPRRVQRTNFELVGEAG